MKFFSNPLFFASIERITMSKVKLSCHAEYRTEFLKLFFWFTLDPKFFNFILTKLIKQ